MPVFWFPFDYFGQLDVMFKLLHNDFLDIDKDKISEILQHLKWYGFVNDEEREYVADLLNRYGVYL